MPEIPVVLYDEGVDIYPLFNIEITVEHEDPAEPVAPNGPGVPNEPVVITLYDGGMPYEVFAQMMDDVENRTDENTAVIYVALHFML
ncbi:hypothetical protein AWZ03_012017 [Drosophila navojoa]|uniref:Uncharacterized protein n=1 Tax=Drosophila navojoa TaxID=7232 RepID=A0A484AYQ0_DRONA|nr:hypothetical protein AWZ03_012017 [Drosophila navojoa]